MTVVSEIPPNTARTIWSHTHSTHADRDVDLSESPRLGSRGYASLAKSLSMP